MSSDSSRNKSEYEEIEDGDTQSCSESQNGKILVRKVASLLIWLNWLSLISYSINIWHFKQVCRLLWCLIWNCTDGDLTTRRTVWQDHLLLHRDDDNVPLHDAHHTHRLLELQVPQHQRRRQRELRAADGGGRAVPGLPGHHRQCAARTLRHPHRRPRVQGEAVQIADFYLIRLVIILVHKDASKIIYLLWLIL